MILRGHRFNDLHKVLALAAIIGVVTPLIAPHPALIDTSVTMATFSLIAISLAMSYGLGGMLSFAQASFASIGAYATAIATVNYGLSPFIGLIFAIAIPALLSFATARLIVRLSPLALGLATLALSQVIELLADEGGEFTGGYIGISGIPEIPFVTDWLWLHLLGWISVLGVLIAYIRLRYSNAGRSLKAISTDDTLAQGLGIRPVLQLTLLFALSGAVAGFAGWFYAHSRTYVAPSSLALDVSFMVAIAVIVGGRRTVIGPVLGTVLIVLLRDMLPGTESHGMFYGAALVVTLLLFPEGIMGMNWSSLFRRRSKTTQSAKDPVDTLTEVNVR